MGMTSWQAQVASMQPVIILDAAQINSTAYAIPVPIRSCQIASRALYSLRGGLPLPCTDSCCQPRLGRADAQEW